MNTKAAPQLSIIVPILNESACLSELFDTLSAQVDVEFELILCDGGSEDGTPERARAMGKEAPFSCRVMDCKRGRGRQMNAGAALARSDLLLFLHADNRLVDPSALNRGINTLEETISRRGDDGVVARFNLRFRRAETTPSVAYYISEAKARLKRPGCIHGDQGFLLRRSFFLRIGPFNESYPFLEDEAMAQIVFQEGEWVLIPAEIETSARRFEIEGLRERHILNALIMNFFYIGEDELLAAMPDIYRSQDRSARLNLLPFFEDIRRHLSGLSLQERLILWYRTGSFVRANAWQLPFAWDQKEHFRRSLAVGTGENIRLKRFERFFDPLTDNPPGRLLAAFLTLIWFHGMLRRLRRGEEQAALTAGKER